MNFSEPCHRRFMIPAGTSQVSHAQSNDGR